jgi:hypothetical protein
MYRLPFYFLPADLLAAVSTPMISVFAQNDEVLSFDLDFCSGILPEQNPVAGVYIDRYANRSAFRYLAGPNGDDLAFLRFFFGAIGNNDSAL